ncbi:MAG: DUF6602 domain-containing protein [Cyanobacteriota bacterium]|jgi:hypothetical protein
MNPNKARSTIDGKTFLREALALEQEVLSKQLQLSFQSITHSGTMGEVNEEHFIRFLRRTLPRRYGVEQGIVIDCYGATSDQIDIIIYDRQYTPPLLDQQNHRYILAEAVYAVLEVKPEINKTYLSAAAGKARSVRSLHRTSVPIPSAEKILPAKRLFPILGGIVAARVEWSDGLKAAAFSDALIALQGEDTLSVGVALQDHAFDLAFASVEPQLTHGPLSLSPSKQGSLAWFLFNLLKRLQDLGTCPAVDWNRYRAVLSTID